MAAEVVLVGVGGSVWVLSGVRDGEGVQLGTDPYGLYEGAGD